MSRTVLYLLLEAFGQGLDGAAPSDTDLTILFSVSVAVVIGIALYAARGVLSRKRTEYDRTETDSKRNRDYEKYHSGWSDDYEEFGKRGMTDEGLQEEIESGMPDCYKVLGISRGATQAEIRSRFRKLAKETHPDRSRGDSKAMAEINRAYEVLSDEETRKKYDRYLD